MIENMENICKMINYQNHCRLIFCHLGSGLRYYSHQLAHIFQIPLQIVTTVVLLKVSSPQAQTQTLMTLLGLLLDKTAEDIVQL